MARSKQTGRKSFGGGELKHEIQIHEMRQQFLTKKLKRKAQPNSIEGVKKREARYRPGTVSS